MTSASQIVDKGYAAPMIAAQTSPIKNNILFPYEYLITLLNTFLFFLLFATEIFLVYYGSSSSSYVGFSFNTSFIGSLS